MQPWARGHRQRRPRCGLGVSVRTNAGDGKWPQPEGRGFCLRAGCLAGCFALCQSKAQQRQRCMKAGASCQQPRRRVSSPAQPHRRATSFWVPGADAATTAGVLGRVSLVGRRRGWRPRQGLGSRITRVDQAGQLKNSFKYPRGMYLFCIVVERINIPKTPMPTRELHDFYKTSHAASFFL